MTKITLKDVKEVREQIQEDLLTILDGLSDEVQTHACQIVVDNMKKLVEKCP